MTIAYLSAALALVVLVAGQLASAQAPEDRYFEGRELTPTAQEQDLLQALSNNRPRSAPASGPIVGPDNSTRYVFGAGLPLVVCAPLQVCDIELQAGEKVRSVQVGDTVRWSVEPAVTGTAPHEVQHVIVKPSDVGLRTSLIVTTDRRTYRMKLASDRSRYMSTVSFAYPSDGQDRWAQLAGESAAPPPPQQQQAPAGRPAAARRGQLSSLSFGYELSGDDPPWKPVRVYNDGLQTVIEMPFAMKQTEAPTLLVVRAEGGVFTDDDVVQVNFHVEGTKYLVDMVFDIADLVVGVGSTQQRVRIRRR